ncbi:hypothetical protein RHMOL_Rhmol05G0159000 [Rhododendron molle]|uniref:Uncharacterized protein n=1 Tax=Rhododendron molle TaxID=49168 RepID=A0ACC0NPR3_RHOML|nr:hypothetical protein RHMOL_Rhmol05G0159000 [Rhododendron molle]
MMKPVKEQPSHIQAWVKLHDLPLELGNQECLNRVASTIGKPLLVDQATTKTSRQSGLLQTKSTSARICIEISAQHELPDDVRITVEGESVVVPVEYQVLPLMCKLCQVFGHSTAQCSKKTPPPTSQTNQDWIVVGNGKPRNHSTSPTFSKHAIDRPNVEVPTNSKGELEKMLERVISNSQESIVKEVTPSTTASISRSTAKKAAKIAAKLRVQEPPDPGVPDIKLLMEGSSKAGLKGKQKSWGSSHRLGHYLDKQQLWAALQQLCVAMSWVVLGDFNAIKSPMEKVGGDRTWLPWMEEFNSCLHSTELVDLRYSGCQYTWSNKQLGAAHISTKIDRVLVNECWIKDFYWSNAHFLSPGVSDHSPAVVYLTAASPSRKRPFKFLNFLADHPKFIDIVQQVWRKVIIGNPMLCVCEKLKYLQEDLKHLNTNEFSELSTRVASYRQQLEAIQKELGSDPSDPSKQATKRELCKQYLVYARAEESFAQQKSRIQWLKLEDQCSSFFFKTIKNSRNMNRISSLVLDDGSLT